MPVRTGGTNTIRDICSWELSEGLFLIGEKSRTQLQAMAYGFCIYRRWNNVCRGMNEQAALCQLIACIVANEKAVGKNITLIHLVCAG